MVKSLTVGCLKKRQRRLGIGWFDESPGVTYYAMVSEMFAGEGNKYHYEKLL
jgi:hypothetical protein